MLALLLCVAARPADPIVRDEYNVPHIKAASADQAFFFAGYAVAQDRLWQMETSRRLARGRMAEVFGKTYAASDREVLLSSYTDEELREQLDSLSPQARSAFENYAKGVNTWIEEVTKSGNLPSGYAENGFTPEVWSPLDSVAIGVRLFQQFGRGGAGEIRNMALTSYLQGRKETKDRFLDVLDDFLWQNEPSSPTTIAPADDPLAKSHPQFPKLTREITERHWAQLPKLGLLEMLPGIRLAMREESTRIAELVNVPFKVGSYCVVVGKDRSAMGSPLLLSGPQMGHRAPSIVHEMSLDAPGISVVGMDVPGAPGVVVGYTPSVAWGLTSGVADTDDIFYFKTEGADSYLYGNENRKLEVISRTLKVKGEPDQKVDQIRTVDGPVVLTSNSTHTVFSRHSSYWMREMQSYEALAGMYGAKTPDDVDRALSHATMSFNFFYAMPSGETGYHYVGMMPIRAEGLDPRFPTPGGPATEWKGMIPFAQMPHVRNPKGGLLANWNNKPVAWWPNLDTPAWGRIFRNSALLATVEKPKLNAQDLEMAAWTIARTDETWPYFKPFLDAEFARVASKPAWMATLAGFDGRLLDGSVGAQIYLWFLDALREELFLGTTGNFISMDNFRAAAQPSVMLKALRGETKVNYLGSRKAADVVHAALERAGQRLVAADSLAGFKAPAITVPGQAPIPYSNRGTYIQIIELALGPRGRNVVSPGISESGAHALDQVPLARSWMYKLMSTRAKEGG